MEFLFELALREALDMTMAGFDEFTLVGPLSGEGPCHAKVRNVGTAQRSSCSYVPTSARGKSAAPLAVHERPLWLPGANRPTLENDWVTAFRQP